MLEDNMKKASLLIKGNLQCKNILRGGSVNVSNSFNVYRNVTSEEYSEAMASLNQKIAEAFKTFNETITSNSII